MRVRLRLGLCRCRMGVKFHVGSPFSVQVMTSCMTGLPPATFTRIVAEAVPGVNAFGSRVNPRQKPKSRIRDLKRDFEVAGVLKAGR